MAVLQEVDLVDDGVNEPQQFCECGRRMDRRNTSYYFLMYIYGYGTSLVTGRFAYTLTFGSRLRYPADRAMTYPTISSIHGLCLLKVK